MKLLLIPLALVLMAANWTDTDCSQVPFDIPLEGERVCSVGSDVPASHLKLAHLDVVSEKTFVRLYRAEIGIGSQIEWNRPEREIYEHVDPSMVQWEWKGNQATNGKWFCFFDLQSKNQGRINDILQYCEVRSEPFSGERASEISGLVRW